MFISVIIPTYNRVETLEKCLANIRQQSIGVKNYEVIIVDDCSSDETPIFCKQYCAQNENFFYFRNERNKGLASTRNVGIRKSTGELLIFLDNDLLVENDYLYWIKRYYTSHENERIVVVTNVTYQPEVLATTNFGTHIQSRAIGYRSPKNMVGLNTADLPSNYFAGGGSSCKRDLAYEIGLFEEGLKKYGSEDELFGYRLKKVGTKIMFCKEAKLIHFDQNILPKFWKIKYIELGRYSLKTLREQEPDLIENSLYRFMTPVNFKTDNFKIFSYKAAISLFASSVFRIPVEKYIFATDKYSIFYWDILYRYITMAWIAKGFKSNKKIKNVEY